MKTIILGTGSWGTALCQVLVDNHCDALMWGIDEFEVNDISLRHKNSRYADVILSNEIHAVRDINIVKDADIILLAVPTNAIENVLLDAAKYINKKVIIINVAKGFHPITHKRLSEVIREIIPGELLESVVSLIGPSHAEEVILRMITVINAVSTNEDTAKTVQQLFSNEYFRVYRNTDEIGAEIGVAIKNIMALASGILVGIGQGDNAKAALMTRGLAEMTRYGISFGGKKETFLGLDGVGDLIVTCTSKHSRNFQAGYEIGLERGAEAFLKRNRKTVEGIAACKVVYEEARKRGISMPITDQVYEVLYKGKDPVEAVHELMIRELKSEII